MASLYYLSKTNGSSKVYFTVNPVPLPDIQPNRKVIVKDLMPGLSGSTPVDAGRVVYDIGSDVSRGTLEITVPFANSTMKTGIDALHAVVQQLYYSPNNGTNIWKVSWQENGYQSRRIDNVSDLWRIQMNFNIMAQIS